MFERARKSYPVHGIINAGRPFCETSRGGRLLKINKMKKIIKQLDLWEKEAKKKAQYYFKEAMPISEAAALSEIDAYKRVKNYILKHSGNNAPIRGGEVDAEN